MRQGPKIKKILPAVLPPAGGLETSDELFRLMIEAIPEGMLIADGQGKIRLVNHVVENLFGYSHDELLNAPIEILLPESLSKGHAVQRHSYHEQPSPRTMGSGRDLFGRRKDGALIPVEIGLNPLQLGRESYVLVTIADIAPRKAKENEIQQLHYQLWLLGRHAILGQLSAAIAHELNQPLTAILSNSQTLQRFLSKTPLDMPQIKEMTADIVRDTRRAGDIILKVRSLLNKTEFQKKTVRINELIQEVLQLVRSDLVMKSTQLFTEFDETLPAVFGDRTQLQQVFLNLIFNGLEAMETCEVRNLWIQTSADHKDGVLISFKDSGKGFKGENEELFKPFFSTKKNGLGMGLAICKDIIQGHKGKIWAENNAESGATFFVSIPV